jgi:transposase
MVNRRIDMRKIRDVLTCLFDKNLSFRETALYTRVGRSAVQYFKERFVESGLSWPLSQETTDEDLERALYPRKPDTSRSTAPVIDFAAVHASLKQSGATLAILHQEWLLQTSDVNQISYSQYCKLYRRFKKSLQLSMRKVDEYGDVAYVDYSGVTVGITNADTGEVKQAQIFVGVLGGSSYTFCEASTTQRSRDWIASHVRMFEYFGGVPRVVVPDNLKAAVTKADRLSPVINETYLAMCRHYGTNPFPARARKPKDKPKAEAGVLLAQRWILYVLRRRKFFSVDEVNREIAPLLIRLNAREFQKMPGCRFSRWLEHERPALMPLPEQRYEFAEWGKVRAAQDYHVQIDQHFYSVPFQLKGEELEWRLTERALELIFKGQVIAVHVRSYSPGATTTLPEHQHPSHKAVTQWSQEQALSWASNIGSGTEAMLRLQISKAPGHLFGYRITEAMRSLLKKYGAQRLEAVCVYALANKVSGSDALRNILSKKLDLLLHEESVGKPEEQITHDNIRGAAYYSRLLQQPREDKV